jgi:integrase/recombinase XerD
MYVKSRSRFRSKSNAAAVVSRLRGLGEFLTLEKVWLKNPMKWLKGPKIEARAKLPRRLSKSSVEELLRAASRGHVHYHRHLWTTLLVVLYSTGLRRGELTLLNLADWNGEQSTLKICGRKTGVERILPVSEAVWRCVEAYLPHRQNVLEKTGNFQETALFVGKFGQRLQGNNVGTGLHKLAKRAGVPLVTLHQFRHSCASDLLESGVRLPYVQKMLGHASVESTMRYLAISDPERRRAIEMHPINEMLAACGASV